MCDLLRSIIKVLLFLVSFSICAEQESTDVNNIAEPELVDSQSKEPESSLLPEDKVIVKEPEAEFQLDSGTETTSPIDVMLVLDNSGSMKKNDPKFLVAEAIKEFISKREGFRKIKDFDSADKMRDSILKIGISLEDGTDSGWSWKTS